MSSTFESTSSLEGLISGDDNAGIVSCLENLISLGSARTEEKLLLGVLLLLPPVADYDGAAEVLDSLLATPCAFEAAIWGAYKYGVLQPDGSRQFESALLARPDSAIAHHMLSLVALADDDLERAVLENRASREIRLFPFNTLSALDNDGSIEEREKQHLLCAVEDLVISRNAEFDPGVRTVEGLLNRKWENLILGTRLTSEYWNQRTDLANPNKGPEEIKPIP